MLKTPVSILQEYTVKKKIASPDYQTHATGEDHCKTFTCHVLAEGQTAAGFGGTKKDAKQDAAKNLLNILGITMDDGSQMSQICMLPAKTSKMDGPMVNYIGKLNEFCSGRRHPQPTYIENVTLHNAQFCIVCTLYDWKTEGYGLNKKDAKQDSAKKMLALIKDSDLEFPIIPVEDTTTAKLEENQELSEHVLKKYTELMKNMSLNDKQRVNNNIETVDGQMINISTWDELTEFFDNHSYAYELTTFQHFPLILSLKVNEHLLMHFGDSREEIRQKFVRSTVEMLRKGIDFAKPLLDL